MKEYKPQTPFLVPAKYFNPTETMKKGVVVKDYEKTATRFIVVLERLVVLKQLLTVFW